MINLLHTESSMNLGGQELRVLLEMEGLESRGYRSLLVARPGSRILKEASGRGLDSYPVEMRGSVDPGAVASIIRIIRREDIDIINTHGSKDGWSAGIAARLTGRKVVRSRHVANPIRSHYFGRLVYGPLCDRIVTTSESIKNGMAERGVRRDKIVSVPTGVDTDVFSPDLDKGAFRKSAGIDPEVRLVGYVSVVRGDKGPDVFVRAAETVLEKNRDVEFALIGDGWMLPDIRDMVERSAYRDRIHVTGYRVDVPQIMADLDLFVLPARVPEGVPQAVLQAHATRTPVIASDVGGVNEVAIDTETASCVPPGDDKALADAIMKLLDEPDRAATLAAGGYGLVIENYTLSAMLSRMDGIYRECLGGRTV